MEKKVAICCVLICYCSIAAGFIIGYWALLFKVEWANEMAKISKIYFGLRILCDIVNGMFYLYNGSCTESSWKGIIVFITWAKALGVEICGLIASFNLLHSDETQCPTTTIDGSRSLLVILFGISLFSVSFGAFQKRKENDNTESGNAGDVELALV